MYTIHQALNLVFEYHLNKLRGDQKKFIKNMHEGLGGMGEVSDQEILNYISPKQADYIKKVAKKFLISTK